MRFNNAYLHLDSNQGSLQFDSDELILDLPSLYSYPLPSLQAHGKIAWQKQADQQDWQVSFKNLVLSAANVDALSINGSLSQQGYQPIKADLNLKLSHADIAQIYRYFPAKITKLKAIKTWLQKSLQQGTVTLAYATLQTEFIKKKWLNGLRVDADIIDTKLIYKSELPPLHQVNAHFSLQGSKINIDLKQGQILQSTIQHAQATIPDYTHPNSHLRVTGKLKGRIADGLQYLRQTRPPKLKQVGKLDLQGGMILDLDLNIPLQRGKSPKISGIFSIQDGKFQAPALSQLNLQLDKLQGEIHFDRQQVYSQALHANLADIPIQIDLRSPVDDNIRLQVKVAGKLHQSMLKQLSSQIRPSLATNLYLQRSLEQISGETDWQLSLAYAQAPKQINPDIDFHTNLKGLRIGLPAPLHKIKRSTKPLHIHIKGEQWQFDWQDSIKANLNTQTAKASLQFGKLSDDQPLNLPEQGIQLQGQLDSLPIDKWQQLFESIPRSSQARVTLPDINTDLTIDRLVLAGQTIDQLAIQGKQTRQQGAWQWQSTQTQGQLDYDGKQNLLDVQIDYLHLDPKPAAATGVQIKTSGIRPQEIPRLWLTCDDLRWRQRILGQWQLASTPTKKGLQIQSLMSELNPNSHLHATGYWSQWEGQDYTQLQINTDSSELSTLLTQLDIVKKDKQQINSKQSKLGFSGGWQGAPWQAQLQTLQGKLNINLQQGQFTQIEPGALARLFALFNVRSLSKRLRLNFDDVIDQGFAFEGINGEFQLERGILYSKDVRVHANAADILLTGYTRLEQKNYQQQLKIIPHISNSLPMTGLLMGGYSVGAITFLLQSLWQQSDVMSLKFDYSLKGSWDQPILTRLVAEPDAETVVANIP